MKTKVYSAPYNRAGNKTELGGGGGEGYLSLPKAQTSRLRTNRHSLKRALRNAYASVALSMEVKRSLDSKKIRSPRYCKNPRYPNSRIHQSPRLGGVPQNNILMEKRFC